MEGIYIHAARQLSIEPVATPSVGPRDVAIRIGAAGICGSDLHYYLHGGFGPIRLREPLVLGHEIAGTIAEVGSDVSHLSIGDRVAVDPTSPCGQCRFCEEGIPRHCSDIRFLGSAMRFPHIQGGFREVLVVRADNALPLSPTISFAEAAMAEPLAVCLHACSRAGDLRGKRVIVTGAGPIGSICVRAARHAGAAEIVATDVNPFALAFASAMGATKTINVAEAGALDPFMADKGYFDVLLEASGSEAAIRSGMQIVRPVGTIIQVGMSGDVSVPLSALVAKEISFQGSFRFDTEFRTAVELLNSGAIDLRPLHTHTFNFRDATEAFETASDKSLAMKVQFSFE